MSPTADTLNSVTFILTVYVGYFIIVTGLIGNITNILIFTQFKIFRENQFAFYLTVALFFDSFQLVFTTSTRVTAAAFGVDPTRTSLAWCKIRQYVAISVSMISVITVCFAVMDQYFSTSYHNQLRQISTFKLARRLIGGLIIFAVLYSIPFPIFYVIRQGPGCSISNPGFNYFYSFVHLCILLGFLPIILSSFLSLLAYRNVRRIVRRQVPIVRRRLDHQLTAMILVRVGLLVCTSLPYVCIRIYQNNNPPDPNNIYAVAVDQLLKIISSTIYTIDFASSYYLYLITSTRFRRQTNTPENDLQVVESYGSAMEGDR